MPTTLLTSSNANGGRFAGLRDALRTHSGGSSSRLAAHQAKMGRTSGLSAASVPAPGKASTSAPVRASAPAAAKASAPAKKISNEQWIANYRSFAVLNDPKAKGKADAVMAMLNADKSLTVPQAIARLDALPFDKGRGPSGGQKPQSTKSADVWAQAYASVFGTGNANINAMTNRNIGKIFPGHQPTAAQPGANSSPQPAANGPAADIAAMTSRNIAKLFPAQASSSDVWAQAYARVFPSPTK